MRYKIVLILFILCGITFVNRAESAYFTGLGDLPGGYFSSEAHDVSADGLVVVGKSRSSSGDEAFRWTQSSGIVGIGDLTGGGFSSEARGVSADGSVIVGRSTSGLGEEAFRWTQSGGMVGLSDLPGGNFYSQADDVSSDGSVVVGYSYSGTYGEAFKWTQGGMIGLGAPPGWRGSSNAYGVSADGSVVVGQGIWEDDTTFYYEAVRWTESEGPVGIGELPGGRYYSDAWNISSDGLVVVGRSTSDLGEEAAYWTETSGWMGLGDLPCGRYQSEARGVSGDGSVIVGLSVTDGDFFEEAFIWDKAHGMRNLKDILINNYGLDLTDWVLTEAKAISDDGLVIVGSGTNPDGNHEAWVAIIDPHESVSIDIIPKTCPNECPIKGGGSVEVAILGAVDFDVNDIDIASVRLEGVAPTRSSLRDKSTPVSSPTECECTTEGRDGFLDLCLKFDKKGLITALGGVDVDIEYPLTLSGELNDGTSIEGQDCIVFVPKGKKD